jgi:hypothetical protein
MGKYNHTLADVGTWRSVRVSECKGSGIAAACALYRQACGKDVDQIVRDPDAQDAAIKGIHAMSTAIKTAKAKLAPLFLKHKVTPAMRTSPYNMTKELLDDWQHEVDRYHEALMRAGTSYHGAVIRREQFLKQLTLDAVRQDRELWADFLEFARSEQNEEIADAYRLFKEGRIQEMVTKYGAQNDYNIDGADNQALLGHFVHDRRLSPNQMWEINRRIQGSFVQTMEGRSPQSVFGRYLNRHQDRLMRILERRFPA